MADKKEIISEEKIKEAARRVFQRNGYSGARMQEIADEAGINKAMLHYYFRSKDNLFEAIFGEAVKKLLGSVTNMLETDIPFKEKIAFFVNSYITLLQENTFLPNFVLNELSNNPERLQSFFEAHAKDKASIFARQISEEIEKENIIKIDPRQFIINMIGLCVFPFASKPIITTLFGLSEEDFRQFIEERKKILPVLLLNSVKL